MQVGGPLNGREGSGGLLAQFQAPEIPKDFYAQADFLFRVTLRWGGPEIFVICNR